MNLVQCILKKVVPRSPMHLRPITVLPVLLKLYLAVILEIESANLDKLSQFQFAFRRERQCHDIIFMMRQLVEKHIEWRGAAKPLYVLEGDIFKAYDCINHMVGVNRLLRKGFRKVSIAAIFREIRRAKSVVKPGDITTRSLTRTRSLCQGGPDAPKIFNFIIDEDVNWFHSMCQTRKWGIDRESCFS